MRKFTCQSDKTLSCLSLESGVWSLPVSTRRSMVCITPLTVSPDTTAMKNVLLQLIHKRSFLVKDISGFSKIVGRAVMCVSDMFWLLYTLSRGSWSLSVELWALGRYGQNLHWVAGRGGGCSQMMDGPFLQVTSGDQREHPCNAQCVHCWRVFTAQRAHKLGARFKKIHHPVQTWQRRVFDDTWDKKHSSTGFNKPRLLPLSVLIRCVDCILQPADRQTHFLRYWPISWQATWPPVRNQSLTMGSELL